MHPQPFRTELFPQSSSPVMAQVVLEMQPQNWSVGVALPRNALSRPIRRS